MVRREHFLAGSLLLKNLTVNRQKRNIFTVNRQMSEPKLVVKFLRYPVLNDRGLLTKWGHQLVEQAINKSSGNLVDVITLIIRIVVIVEDQ